MANYIKGGILSATQLNALGGNNESSDKNPILDEYKIIKIPYTDIFKYADQEGNIEVLNVIKNVVYDNFTDSNGKLIQANQSKVLFFFENPPLEEGSTSNSNNIMYVYNSSSDQTNRTYLGDARSLFFVSFIATNFGPSWQREYVGIPWLLFPFEHLAISSPQTRDNNPVSINYEGKTYTLKRIQGNFSKSWNW